MDDEKLVATIDRIIEISRYYFYDEKYKDNKKVLKKLRKKVKKGKIDECTKE